MGPPEVLVRSEVSAAGRLRDGTTWRYDINGLDASTYGDILVYSSALGFGGGFGWLVIRGLWDATIGKHI